MSTWKIALLFAGRMTLTVGFFIGLYTLQMWAWPFLRHYNILNWQWWFIVAVNAAGVASLTWSWKDFRDKNRRKQKKGWP
jgi:hypothetical protein